MRETIIKILNKNNLGYRDSDSDSTLISILRGLREDYWSDISCRRGLSEEFIREFQDRVNWDYICLYQILSEGFIREFQDKVDWGWISKFQKLSEEFIREFKDEVDWEYISMYQKLSENLIRDFKDEVDWNYISRYQRLSEDFIRELKERVNWDNISISQTLSEDFIREFPDKVDWVWISIYQILSEDFIREFRSDFYDDDFVQYQKLSDSFLKEFNLTKPDLSVNWLYATKEYKLDFIKNHTQYEVIDNEYVIAYIADERYDYEEGQTYERMCDCRTRSNMLISDLDPICVDEKRRDRFTSTKKVRINIEDVGVVDPDKYIRCFKWTVLQESQSLNKCPRCSTELIEKRSQSFSGSSTYIVKKCPNCGYCA